MGLVTKKIYFDIIKSLKNKINFPINEKESYRTTKLLNSFYRADELKRTVSIKRITESKRLGKKDRKLNKLYSV